MAWTLEGAATQVQDSTYPFAPVNLPLTSTSTILLSEGDTNQLRMYLHDHTPYISAVEVASGDAGYRLEPGVLIFCTSDSLWTERETTETTQRFRYVDSTSGFPITPDLHLPAQLFSTCIPRVLEDALRPYVELVDLEEGTWVSEEDPITVTYKDPSVVALPKASLGGWLMVVARYLVAAEQQQEEPEPEPDPGGSSGISPDNSFAQIVGWWSDTPDFTGENTIGPFLLVDGASAWADGAYARLWLGTPGVVVVPREDNVAEFDLYVYYSADETSRGYRDPSSADEILRDQVSYRDYRRALAEQSFFTGIACKRIPLRALAARVEAEQDEPGSFPYTDYDAWDPSSVVGGTLLGGVRLWFPTGVRRAFGHVLRAFYGDYSRSAVRQADPAPLRCTGPGSNFSLFLAANIMAPTGTAPTPEPLPATATALGSGHGLWRGRSIPDGTGIVYRYTLPHGTGTYTRHYLAALGKDFLCANQDASTSPTGTLTSPDQIVEAGDFTSENFTLADPGVPTLHIWLDPDPVQLSDGSVCVAAGAALQEAADATGENAEGDLVLFAGTVEDGCATASALLDDDEFEVPLPGGGALGL